jgi:hypothetical protein
LLGLPFSVALILSWMLLFYFIEHWKYETRGKPVPIFEYGHTLTTDGADRNYMAAQSFCC